MIRRPRAVSAIGTGNSMSRETANERLPIRQREASVGHAHAGLFRHSPAAQGYRGEPYMYRCSMAHIQIKGNMFRAVFWKQSNCLRLRPHGASHSSHAACAKRSLPSRKLCLTITGSPAGEESGGQPQRLSKKNACSARSGPPSTPMRVSSLARNQGTGFRHSPAGSTVIPKP
jgi:hypothetical protein